MYEWIKILHILSWTSWMAGLFYLPRLFVYHAERANDGGPTAETFKVMEDKLYRLIMTPAMVVAWTTGLWLAFGMGVVDWRGDGWFHGKLLLVVLMTGVHHMLKGHLRRFAADANRHSGRYYRVLNEAPTLLFVGIVVLAILRPF